MVKQVLILEATADLKKFKQTLGLLPWNHKVRREGENIVLLFEQALLILNK